MRTNLRSRSAVGLVVWRHKIKVKRFTRFLFISLIILILASLGMSGPTARAAAAKMRWDIISLTVKDGKPNLAAGGSDAALANNGTGITLTGSGTFGPGESDPVTGGGEWTTFDLGADPTATGKFTVKKLISFQDAPGTLPDVVVDTIGKNADARAGVAVLWVAYSADDKANVPASEGVLVVTCRLPAGTPDSVSDGIVASKGFTTFWNRVPTVDGIDAGRTVFHIVR